MNKEKIRDFINKMCVHFSNGEVLFDDKESIVRQVCFLSKFISTYNGSPEHKIHSTQVLAYITYNELVKMGYKLTTPEYMYSDL